MDYVIRHPRKRAPYKVATCCECGKAFAVIETSPRLRCHGCEPFDEIVKGSTNWQKRKEKIHS